MLRLVEARVIGWGKGGRSSQDTGLMARGLDRDSGGIGTVCLPSPMAAVCSAPEAKIARADPPAWVSDEVLQRDRDIPTLALTGWGSHNHLNLC